MCDTAGDLSLYTSPSILDDTVKVKKAAIVAVFILYIIYMVSVAAKYGFQIKGRLDASIKFDTFTKDLTYKGFFFLFLGLIIQIQAPTNFGAVIMWIYLLSTPLVLFGILRPDKWKIRLIGLAFQVLVCIIMLLYVVINPWCRFLYLRYFTQIPNTPNVLNASNQ